MLNTKSTAFTLMVSKSPFDHRNAENALTFCYAAIAQGHTITQVFFYQTGVHNASCLLSPNQDEVHVYKLWIALFAEHKINLNVCISAASRRGVIGSNLAEEKCVNLKAPFNQVGLSAYFEALADNSVNIQL